MPQNATKPTETTSLESVANLYGVSAEKIIAAINDPVIWEQLWGGYGDPIVASQAVAQFLLLTIANLTGCDEPDVGGAPVYLSEEEAAGFAAEGIRSLARFLPQGTDEQVAAAVERIPRRSTKGTPKEMLTRIFKSGGMVVIGSGGEPGCCSHGPHGGIICIK